MPLAVRAYFLTKILNKFKMATIIQNLLSVEDFAKLKGVTVQTVYNWIKDGKVKKVEFLKKPFVDKSTYKSA